MKKTELGYNGWANHATWLSRLGIHRCVFRNLF